MNSYSETEKVNSFLETGKPMVFRWSGISETNFQTIRSTFRTVLEKLGREDLEVGLGYVINEMITNADKANIKRLLFKERKLDVNDPRDYEKGIRLFSRLDEASRKRLGEKLAESGYYTQVTFQLEGRRLSIITVNSSIPSKEELARIHSRVALSETVKDIAEAYMSVYDDSEGAGFGIITTILLLRSLGVHNNPYRFVSLPESNESKVEVQIPLSALSDNHIQNINEAITKEIKSIPKLPENVVEIQRMLSNPERNLSDIADVIARDPALTAELLKVVNSAQYMLPKRISNIQQAVILVGMTGIRNLMYMYGAQQVVSRRYNDLNNLWDHAYRCAFYSSELARRFKCVGSTDEIYVGGILHDIGKIVLMSLHGKLLDRISTHCRNTNIPGDFLETLVLGIGHAKTGAVIAQNWNLPESLVCPIEFHHQPFSAPAAYRNNAYVVHLADVMANEHDQNGIDFKTITQDVLTFFGIKDEAQFKALSQTLASKLAETVVVAGHPLII